MVFKKQITKSKSLDHFINQTKNESDYRKDLFLLRFDENKRSK